MEKQNRDEANSGRLFLMTVVLLVGLPAGAQNGSRQTGALIPFAELATKAGGQYHGDGLSVLPTPEGARLRCIFQQLEGQATPEGLWLVSTADRAKNERFRVTATSICREARCAAAGVGGTMFQTTGTVTVVEKIAQFIRPGLVEEYSVSIDGVRQDFLVLQRPGGEGKLRVELEVAGANAEAMVSGARLLLDSSGRKINYSRLHAVDAKGRELTARMEVTSANCLTVVVDDAAATYPVRIDPTFSDANWFSMGSPLEPGVNDWVYALAVSGTDLFVGGRFTTAGGVPANRIAKWNGSAWSSLGSGLNNEVFALAVSGTDLFVGGRFTTAGGVPASRIAKWNGSAWSSLGSGVTSPVYALAVSGADLYVGGNFTTGGGLTANYIAKWNGSAWSGLGSGLGNEVYALAVSGTALYVGGYFTTAGSASANYIARWNGSAWSDLGSGLDGSVYALAVSGTALFAGGIFTTAGGQASYYLARAELSRVTNTNDSGAGSLRAAILNAAPGETLTFASNVTGTITLTSGELVIGRNLIINGPGAKLLTLSGNNASRIFHITGGDSLITNLRIADGYSEGNGGGIAVSGGVLYLAYCAVAGCYADSIFGGGGISVGPGGLSLFASTIYGNTTPYYGGGISVNSGAGIVNVISSTVSGNSAGGGFFEAYGGGIYVGNANVNVIDTTIANNSSATAGGGISRYGTVTIRNSLIAGNSAPTGADCNGTFLSYGYNLIGNSGGCAGFNETGDQLNVNPQIGPLQDNGGPTFTHALRPGSPAIDKGQSFGYTTDQRGGIRPFDFISDSNTSGGDGSDIGAFEVGSGEVRTQVVSNNNDSGTGSLREAIEETYSGGIVTFASNVVGAITLTSGELLMNRAMGIEGPGAKVLAISGNNASRVFHIIGGTSAISNLRIANGHASAGGGGIAMDGGSLTVSNCAITGCYAQGVDVASQGGGAIAVVGAANLAVIGSTLSSNTTPYAGGGLYLFNAPTVSLINCTISGNRTLDGDLGDGGGGIFVGNSSKLNVTNSTIANNSSAAQGGGIYKGLSGTVNVGNSLIAGNSAGGSGPDCKGTFVSAGYNLIGNSSGSTGFGSTGDQLNMNPLIGPLQDNGGPTLTHALLAGSPAIDKGATGGPTSDQRGRARPYDFGFVANASGGDGSDIGAYELNPPVLSISRAASNVVLSWPAYDTGYTLEAKINLNASINWSNVPDTPTILAGQFTVTNSATLGNKFYRLRSP